MTRRRERLTQSLYSRDMLIERPLLQALTQAQSPVLLIDELDRADEPFDAFLLEVLAENQITIPELGTDARERAADQRHHEQPHARDPRRAEAALPVPLGRFPSVERELEIVRLKAPGAAERLYVQVVEFVQRMRTLDLFKAPGVAETIDWTNALVALNAIRLDPATVHDTLGVLLKYQDDIVKLQSGDTAKLLDELQATARVRATVTSSRCSPRTSSTSRACCAAPACRSGPTACSPRWRRSSTSASTARRRACRAVAR